MIILTLAREYKCSNFLRTQNHEITKSFSVISTIILTLQTSFSILTKYNQVHFACSYK